MVTPDAYEAGKELERAERAIVALRDARGEDADTIAALRAEIGERILDRQAIETQLEGITRRAEAMRRDALAVAETLSNLDDQLAHMTAKRDRMAGKRDALRELLSRAGKLLECGHTLTDQAVTPCVEGSACPACALRLEIEALDI